jgi:hypothetical protein
MTEGFTHTADFDESGESLRVSSRIVLAGFSFFGTTEPQYHQEKSPANPDISVNKARSADSVQIRRMR